MPKIVQHRRGTTAQVAGITGAVGELFVDTSKVTVVVMDGILQGGVALATETSVTAVSSALSTLSSNLNTLSSNISTYVNTATTVVIGVVRPDGTSILVTSGVIAARLGSSSTAGILRPDGTSILVTSGVISANISVGSSSLAGILRPDGTSILVTSGVISIGQATISTANTTSAGISRPNNTSIVINAGIISVNNNVVLSSLTVIATTSSTSVTSGAIVCNGGAGIAGSLFVGGTITELSAAEYKENILPITDALNSILQLTGVTYDRRDGSRKNEAGLIAQEVNKILPNIVSLDEHGHTAGIQYTKLTAYLIEAVKSLKSEIDALKNK